jgi:hypothetical protein
MPVFWKEVNGEIPQPMAEAFVNTVYTAQSIAQNGFLFGVLLGGLMVVIGSIVLWMGLKMKRQMKERGSFGGGNFGQAPSMSSINAHANASSDALIPRETVLVL